MADYIPAGDTQFQAWQNNFVTYVNAHLVDLGLEAADVVELNATAATWTADFPAHIAAQNTARGAREAKDNSREAFQGSVRPLVRRLQASPDVTDAERAEMGITVPDREGTPEGPPKTRPVVNVDTSQRLQHTIAFADEATPTRKAKPAGVIGAEVWVKLGDPPPTGPKELSFLSMDSRTPYVAHYSGEDAGQIAHYMLRWVTTTGEKGPWSETASATIGA